MTTTDRVADYLDDLARMLADLDPGERDDILAGVRDHLDAAVAEHPGDPAALDAALLRLGPPEQVAAAARGTSPAAPPVVVRVASVPPVALPPPPPQPGLARTAVAVVTLSTGVTLLLVLSERIGQLNGGQGMFGPMIALFLGLSIGAPPWLAGLLCALMARGFTSRTRVALAVAGPVGLAVAVVGTLWQEPETASAVVTVVLAAAAVLALLAVAWRAWREIARF